MKVIPDSSLPYEPSLSEDVVRMVRHGMADILEALGEDVGPKPGEPVNAVYSAALDTLFVSQDQFRRMMARRGGPWI